MSGLELNKLAAAILVAGLLAMTAGTISRIVYKTDDHHGAEQPKRGYKIEVTGDGDNVATKTEDKEDKIDIAALMASADPVRGKKVSKKCMSCHSFEKGGPNKFGPNLWGVLGGSKRHNAKYPYSKAFKALEGKWDYESIFEFLKSPRNFVKGTRMSFIGLKKPQDIANIVAYLRQMSDNRLPLPKVEKSVSPPAEEESAPTAPSSVPEELPVAPEEDSSETEDVTEESPTMDEKVVSPFESMVVITPPEEEDSSETEDVTEGTGEVIFNLKGSPDLEQPVP